MRKYFWLAIFLSISVACFADTILLKSGAKIDAPVIERTENYIRANIEGMPVTYYTEEIQKVSIKSAPAEVPLNQEKILVPPQNVLADPTPAASPGQ
jgi:hypothetical protein